MHLLAFHKLHMWKSFHSRFFSFTLFFKMIVYVHHLSNLFQSPILFDKWRCDLKHSKIGFFLFEKRLMLRLIFYETELHTTLYVCKTQLPGVFPFQEQ